MKKEYVLWIKDSHSTTINWDEIFRPFRGEVDVIKKDYRQVTIQTNQVVMKSIQDKYPFINFSDVK